MFGPMHPAADARSLPRASWKGIRRLLVLAGSGLGVGLGLVLAFVAEENLRGQLQLRQVRQRLRDRHEPLTVADLRLPDFSAGATAGQSVVQAGKELAALAKTNPLASQGPTSLMGWSAPGQATVQHRAPTFLARQARIAPGKDGRVPVYEWPQLERELANAEAPLARLREALRQPLAAPTVDYRQDFGSPSPALPWDTFLWLASAATAALHAQNYDVASDDILALLSLAEYERRDFRLSSQVYTVVVNAFTMPLLWEALQEDRWPDAQLAGIQSALAQATLLDSAFRSLELERTRIPTRYAGIRQSRDAQLVAFRLEGHNLVNDLVSDEEVRYPSETVVRLRAIFWGAAWSRQDEARTVARWQDFMAEVRRLRGEKSWAAFDRRFPEDQGHLEGLTLWRHSFSETLGPQAARLLLQRTVRTETGRQMTLAAIALKRYTRRTGVAPPSLQTLVPEFLPEVPTDWMDGQPLRYRAQAGKEFVLYSVGTDGRDDGGDPRPSHDQKMHDLWSDHDAVWPVAVTPP